MRHVDSVLLAVAAAKRAFEKKKQQMARGKYDDVA